MRSLLQAESDAGARIWIDDPQMTMGPGGDFAFRRFLAEKDIPYFGLGGCADLAITHMLVKGKLVPTC